jgi:hypothetical protein
MKMGNNVVHDEDEAPMLVIGGRLPNGRIVEDDVMMFAEMRLRDDAWGAALGHVGRMAGPNMELRSVAIMIGKVELSEPVSVDINVEAYEDDGGWKAWCSCLR